MPESSTATGALLTQYLDDPLALLLAAILVVCFSVWKFNRVPPSFVQELKIAPPDAPRLLTTLIKFRLGLSLYAGAWLLLFGVLAVAPDLLRVGLDLAVEFKLDPGGGAAALRDYLAASDATLATLQPVIAGLAMVLIGQIFPFARGDEALRATLFEWVEIPFKAETLAADLAGRGFRAEEASGDNQAPDDRFDRVRAVQLALYDDWQKLAALNTAVGGWSASTDFSRFALRYADHLSLLREQRNGIETRLETLDLLLRPADALDSAEVRQQVLNASADIASALEDHYRIVSRAALASLATERARECALGAMGFEARPIPDRAFPLDATALTLLATTLFVMLTLLTLGFYLVPPALFGLHSETMSRLGVPASVAWGFWGTVMHFGVVVAVALCREQLRGTGLERVLLGRGGGLPLALYLAMGLLGFVIGGVVAVTASYALYGAFMPDKFVWGAVTFVTGFSVPLHEDRAGRFWGRLGGRNPVERLLTAHGAAWTVQGTATGTVGVLTYLYLLGNLHQVASVDWVFVTFVLVGTGAIGAVVGYYLPAEFHRLKEGEAKRRSVAPPGGPTLGVAA